MTFFIILIGAFDIIYNNCIAKNTCNGPKAKLLQKQCIFLSILSRATTGVISNKTRKALRYYESAEKDDKSDNTD